MCLCPPPSPKFKILDPRHYVLNARYNLIYFFNFADVDGKVRRFHSMVTEWGFDKFLSLEALMNDSNGYIKGDSCVFGAEVFVIKHYAMKSPSISEETNTDSFTWKIDKFSSLKDKKYTSNTFVIGGYAWYHALNLFILFAV